MKRICITAAFILMLCTMTGCSCKHETWNEADCTTPRTCAECGETEGEPLGHNWLDATCKKPKTCESCGETEGEPLEHVWLDATCEEPKTCELCGETEGEALGHTTERGKCKHCSEYILTDAFIPDENDYADCIGLSTIPGTYTYSFSDTNSTGFDVYVSIPASERIAGCADLGWDVMLGYVGDSEFNILSRYAMNYVPENESDLDDLYDAILHEMTNRFGKASTGNNTWNRQGASITASKVSNGVSVLISLDEADINDSVTVKPSTTKKASTTTAPKNTTTTKTRTTKKTSTTTATKKTTTTKTSTTKKTSTTTQSTTTETTTTKTEVQPPAEHNLIDNFYLGMSRRDNSIENDRLTIDFEIDGESFSVYFEKTSD